MNRAAARSRHKYRMRVLCGAVSMAALLPTMSGCDGREVPLAEYDDEVHQKDNCRADADCKDPAAYCRKTSCGVPSGICERKPSVCLGNFAPTCGCDGVTYWNECARRRSGVAERETGECTRDVAQCNAAQPCKNPEALCARLLPPAAPDRCEQRTSGTCWALADDCAAPKSPSWSVCGEPSGQCQDLCAAIQSQKPVSRGNADRCR
jgi:hypothetical protein